MTRSIEGSVAVVTGASRGIGRAIAVELASLGANLVVTARTDVTRSDIAGTIGETVAAIEAAGGKAIGVKADLLVDDDLDRLVDETMQTFGHVDVLVNNAAYIGEAVFESFWDMTDTSWREMLALNVNVPWALTKRFAPAMRERGGGLVVNLSSPAAHGPGEAQLPLPGAGGLGAAYPTSKAALNQFTAFVGNELRPAGIAMVAVDPGFARSESAEIFAARLGVDASWAQPVEVAAKAVGFLATCDDPLEFAGRCLSADELAGAR